MIIIGLLLLAAPIILSLIIWAVLAEAVRQVIISAILEAHQKMAAPTDK